MSAWVPSGSVSVCALLLIDARGVLHEDQPWMVSVTPVWTLRLVEPFLRGKASDRSCTSAALAWSLLISSPRSTTCVCAGIVAVQVSVWSVVYSVCLIGVRLCVCLAE